MIGLYDYTVILTYLSLASAGFGIVISLSGNGHPYVGLGFLLFCGLCDAFDGKVARMKHNRSEIERNFGIQIDSLSDLVAFGVLPACIGAAMMRSSTSVQWISEHWARDLGGSFVSGVLMTIMILYILAAMIRLAYFNVTEEERQKTEKGGRVAYVGLPVTSAALIFPALVVLQYIIPADITLVYFAGLLITAVLFVSRLRVPKPGLRGILVMVGAGLVEFAALLVCRWLKLR